MSKLHRSVRKARARPFTKLIAKIRPQPPRWLVQSVSQFRVVAYLGAGFSAPYGMPGWTGLLSKLARRAQDNLPDSESEKAILRSAKLLLQRGRLAESASRLRKLLHGSQIRDIIRECYGATAAQSANVAARKQMSRRLSALSRLPFAGIVTTNYDTTIEDNLPTFRREFARAHTADRLGSILFDASLSQAFFVKLHGVLDGEIVLTTEEYSEAYLADTRVTKFLEAMMLRYAIIFVGCSLEDELVRIRRKLVLDYKLGLPPCFALFAKSDENHARAEMLEPVGITCLLYDNDRGDHSEVEEFLERLAGHVEREQQISIGFSRGATTKEFIRLSPMQRLRQAGKINQEIVGYIKSLKGGNIEHAALAGVYGRLPGRVPRDVAALSTNELIYRILFLVNIGIIDEVMTPQGKLLYRVGG